MNPIVEWNCKLKRLYPDATRNEHGICEVEIILTKRGLKIVKLEILEARYRFEMCERAATSWIQNNPDDPAHAIKIVNDTLKNYRTQVERNGDSFIIEMKDYRR